MLKNEKENDHFLIKREKKRKTKKQKRMSNVDKSQQYDKKKATQVSLLMKNIE